MPGRSEMLDNIFRRLNFHGRASGDSLEKGRGRPASEFAGDLDVGENGQVRPLTREATYPVVDAGHTGDSLYGIVFIIEVYSTLSLSLRTHTPGTGSGGRNPHRPVPCRKGAQASRPGGCCYTPSAAIHYRAGAHC